MAVQPLVHLVELLAYLVASQDDLGESGDAGDMGGLAGAFAGLTAEELAFPQIGRAHV